MPNKAIEDAAQSWEIDSAITPRLIACVYSYMTTKYLPGQTLVSIERDLGIYSVLITKALKALEEHGYVAISRHSKPFQYRIIK